MKWITRKKVKVDRVARPWLIKKFVDKDAEFMHWILMDAKVHGFFFFREARLRPTASIT